MSEKYNNTCKYLNYFKHILILVLTVTGYFSISEFALLAAIPAGITNYAVEKKNCALQQESKSISQL